MVLLIAGVLVSTPKADVLGSSDGDPAGLGKLLVPGAPGDEADAVGPWSIGLMVANAGSLTAQERSLTAMLEGNGHTVTPFTVTAEPIVNAANNPTIDLLVFSPSFVFSALYHPAQPDSLPMLDMTKYSWYRRNVLPWNNEIAGPRFSGTGETSTEIFFEDEEVIDWDGQQVGPVQVLTAPRFAGEAPMRAALDHSTDGDAQYFLRQMSDTGAESALGVYVPPGSTITEPAPTVAEEQRRTSIAPWIGLLVFVDDWGNGNQYAELTAAGEGLFEAAMHRLMNPTLGPIECSGSLSAEVEDGLVAGAFVVVDDPEASGGQAVGAPQGSGRRISPDAPTDYVDVCLTVAEPGSYALEATVRGPDGASDSFWVSRVDSATVPVAFRTGNRNSFGARIVSDAGVPVTYALDPGEHTFRFALREDGALVDNITLEPVPAPIECSGSLSAEVEDGLVAGAFVVVDDPEASGGQAVGAPQGSGRRISPDAPTDYVDVCLTVAEPGSYALEATVRGPDGASDSFWVSRVDSATVPVAFRTGNRNSFGARIVSDAGVPVTYALDPGEHTFRFALREDGALVDNITLEPVPAPIECSGSLSAEVEDGLVAGAFVVVDDPEASGGQAVGAPQGSGRRISPDAPTDYVDVCLTVAEPGSYALEATVRGPDGASDSFWVSRVDSATVPVAFRTGNRNSFGARIVSDAGVPVTYALDPGEHTFRFALREDGALVDNITLVGQ